MSENEEETKKWVKDKLQELAEKHHVQLKSLEWGQSSEDFDRNKWSLKITTTGSKAVIERFRSYKLEYCFGKSQASQDIKAELEERLVRIVKSLIPSQQAG